MFNRKARCASCGFLESRQIWVREYPEDEEDDGYRAEYVPASAYMRENSKVLRHAVKERGPGQPFRCSLQTFDLGAEVDEEFDSRGTPDEWLMVISRERDCHTFEKLIPNMTIAAHSDRLKSRVEKEQKREERIWEIVKPMILATVAFVAGLIVGNAGLLSEAIDKINPF